MYVKGFRKLFEFPGYVVDRVSMDGGQAQVWLRRDGRLSLRCTKCNGVAGENRRTWQSAWDLPLGTAVIVRVCYEAVQGYCSNCNSYLTVHPEGIDTLARATRRLMVFVSQLCRYVPVLHVPDIVPVPRSTVHRWDKRILTETLPQVDLDNLEILLIDEKAIGKHHQYVTFVMNGVTGDLLHMAEGKKKESLLKFFKKLTDEQKARIKAVAVDRAGAYYEAIKEQLPDAKIVFDKFHLIKNYSDVIDKVRRSEWRQAAEEDKSVIKGQRYNLFRNKRNLKPDQRKQLRDLLEMNENLSTVYVLKDDLKKLWTYKYKAWAGKFLDRWLGWAREARIDALSKFADALESAREEILNFCKFPITTAKLEAFNATVSRILYRACGVSDLDYLFLKLRQETQ
jgi:transposase